MSNNKPSKPGSTPGGSSSLTERVQARVTASKAAGSKKTREIRSLGRVFHELGDTHRQYRLETGERVSPELKQAANAFKKEQSLATLVAVAAFLDEDGLLAW